MSLSVRDEYSNGGVDKYYISNGGSYKNTHEDRVVTALGSAIDTWSLDVSNVLDLSCGSGEITMPLINMGANVTGIDPYTTEAYNHRTGLQAECLNFQQIATGALTGRSYSLIVCSYAMHLAERSVLPMLCYNLSMIAPYLLILTPHKKPEISHKWGWALEGELYIKRIKARMYRRK